MFEQATIAIRDEKNYAELHQLMETAFDTQRVDVFLDRVTRSRMRIRDFEGILNRGFFGREATGLYQALPVSDRGLTREHFLRLVEAVPQELRERYFRAYAYY